MGTKFEDVNGDKERGPGVEPGIEGIEIILKDEAGDIVAITTTDGVGEYFFDNIPEGNYE